MPHIPYPSQTDINNESSNMLEAFQKAYARPSHIFRLLSWNSNFLQAASDSWHQLVVEPSKLERRIKEACVVITCSTHNTEYCIEGHSHALRLQGMSQEQVKAIQDRDFEGFSDPELSIFRFVHKAAADPKTLTREDYRSLELLNYSNEVILELLGIVWANTAMNMIVDALDVRRTDEMKSELNLD